MWGKRTDKELGTQMVERINYPRELDELIARHCPETADKVAASKFYIEPARALYRHLKEASAFPAGTGKSFTRFRFQLQMAVEAIRAVDCVATQSYRVLSGTRKWDWHRAVWSRSLTWGLGDYICNLSVSNTDRYINLLTTSVPEGELMVEARKEPLKHHFNALELGLSHTLGIAIQPNPDEIDYFVWLYLQESYWSTDILNNPLLRIMEHAHEFTRESLRKMLDLDVVIRQVSDNGLITVAARNERLIASKQHASTHKTPSVLPSDEGNTTKVNPREAYAPKKVVPAIQPAALTLTKPQIVAGAKPMDGFVRKLTDMVRRGELSYNCKGAYLHVTPDGYLGVTHPQGMEYLCMLQKMDLPSFKEQLEKAGLLIESGQRYFFSVVKGKNRTKHLPINLMTLNRQFLNEELQALPVNDAIVAMNKDTYLQQEMANAAAESETDIDE